MIDGRDYDEQLLEDGGIDPGLLYVASRKMAMVETTVGPYFRLIINGLKESEAKEIVDILRARGWLL